LLEGQRSITARGDFCGNSTPNFRICHGDLETGDVKPLAVATIPVFSSCDYLIVHFLRKTLQELIGLVALSGISQRLRG
jgi:hypothetical protein